MGKPNYRVLVSFDRERNVFHARTPELEHLSGEGATRAEAIAQLETEIDAQLANMLSSGTAPPRALDDIEYTGEVQAKISRGMHRDLAHLARAEGVELSQIVSELLSAALAVRQGGGRGRHAGRPAPEPSDDIGNRADGNRGGGDHNRDGNRRPFGRNNFNSGALDDRASFIEYVRTLDHGEGNGGPRNQGGHGGGGPGGGGRRHRRGGGGGGRGPQHGGPPGQGQGHGRDGNRGPHQRSHGGPGGHQGQRPNHGHDRPAPGNAGHAPSNPSNDRPEPGNAAVRFDAAPPSNAGDHHDG